jgi:hypothetical protein
MKLKKPEPLTVSYKEPRRSTVKVLLNLMGTTVHEAFFLTLNLIVSPFENLPTIAAITL